MCRMLVLLLGCLGVCPAADPLPFIEQNGVVVMEMESGHRIPNGADDWILRTAEAGYTGSGYLEWKPNSTGAFQDGAKSTDVIRFRVAISTTGTYRFIWRSSRPPNATDKHNDAHIRCVEVPIDANRNPAKYTVAANTFVKCYHSTQNGAWGWGGTLDRSHEKGTPYITFANPGTYTIDIGGRSNKFRLDRIVLYRMDQTHSPSPTDTNRPESTRGAGGGGDAGGDGGGTTPPSPGSPGAIRWSVNTSVVGENAGTVQLKARRVNGSTGAIAATWTTANGSAQAGSDYTAASGTVSWADGNTADQSVAIAIVDDAQVEADETFTVTLSAPTGGATLGSPATVTVTIQDNDGPPVVGFTSTLVQVGGNAVSAALSVVRSGNLAGTSSVTWTTAPGDAQAGIDYVHATGTLTWSAGDGNAKTITVDLLPGVDAGAPRSFVVILQSPSAGTQLSAESEAVVTRQASLSTSSSAESCGFGSGGVALLLLSAVLSLRTASGTPRSRGP